MHRFCRLALINNDHAPSTLPEVRELPKASLDCTVKMAPLPAVAVDNPAPEAVELGP